MENRPPQQETPRRPPNPVRKTNGSGGPPTPPWLWLIVIGLLALIFWHFVPKTEQEVPYHPWFTEQVDKGNIKSISIQGTEIRGELFQDENYSPPSGSPIRCERFYTYVPSEEMIQSIVEQASRAEGRGAEKPRRKAGREEGRGRIDRRIAAEPGRRAGVDHALARRPSSCSA